MAKSFKFKKPKTSESSSNSSWINYIPVLLFAVLLFLDPLFLDIKLSRPKLMLLEMGLYGIVFAFVFSTTYLGLLKIKKTPTLIPVLLYFATVAIFYLFSPDKLVAFNEFKRALLSCIGYLVAANIVNSDKQRIFVIWAWMLGSFLAILYGVMQHSGGFMQIMVPKMDRVMSTFGNPIFFAAHIIAVFPLAVAMFFVSRSSKAKWFLFSFIVFALWALFYTKTRAAYIAFAGSIGIFIWLNIKSKKVKVSFISAIILFSGIFVVFTKDIWTRQQAHSLIWRDTLTMWSESPWFGTGPGTFPI